MTMMKNKACIIALFEIHVFGVYKSDNDSTTSKACIAFLSNHELIKTLPKSKTDLGNITQYALTQRGLYWIEFISKVPLPEPVTTWQIPNLAEE